MNHINNTLFGAVALLLSSMVLAKSTDTQNSPPPQNASTMQPARPMTESLTDQYAKFRKQQILSVDYQLSFSFDKHSKNFSGVTHINANINPNNQAPITLDFDQGKIISIKVNNKPVTWQFSKWFISLASQLFVPGNNSIEIVYQHPYSTDGSGLNRFVDPKDGAIYLYSDFEPYDAHKLFPHFDQPDLKATFQSTVTAPADWQVISTTRETQVVTQNGQKIWHFPASKKIASYVYAMHAGPYHVWQDKFETIPLRLFARQSIAKYVKPDDWFTPTKQSFAFYNQYFKFAYPFGKYDQIMAPDFNSGAMENVAAVTFNEAYVSRGEKSIARKRDLANTIAHEMAHMWFGDLVTMQWWNGLWLNESFATYMSNLALSKSSNFTNVWDSFYSKTKQWAYATDESANTHAIELPVHNTAEAFSNFDGITYGKGASVLKQIPYYLGEQNFQQGVVNYLKKFAYQNTSLADFINELSKASGKDLSQWSEQWLYQAGLNSIQAKYQCQNNKISAFVINQSAPKNLPTLREQRVQIGFYQLTNNRLTLTTSLPVTYTGEHTTVNAAVGQACPDLVYPNLDDWGYVKINLDARSLTTLQQHIHDIDNNSLRLMLWQGLWDNVRDIKLPLTDYINFAIANIPVEQDETIVRNVVAHLTRAASYLDAASQQGKQVGPIHQSVEQLMWQQLNNAGAGSELQKIWYSHFVSVAQHPLYLAKLEQLLNGKLTLSGITIDQDKRWAIIHQLNEYQFGAYQALLVNESKHDQSDSGRKAALFAEASRPDEVVKAKWFNVILNNPDHLKLSVLRGLMSAIFPTSQTKLKLAYIPTILEEIPVLNDNAELNYLSAFASRMSPTSCSVSDIPTLQQATQDFSKLKPQVSRPYKDALQEDQRCVAIVKLLAQ